MMTLAACESFGGVAGALAKRAEEIYAGFDEAEQAATRQVMLRLVTLGDGVEDTRRRVLFSELLSVTGPEESRANHSQPAATPPTVYPPAPGDGLRSSISTVIDVLGWARLLTFDRDPSTREPTVEVAHEALLREWARLRRWLDESRADVRLQRLLAAETAAWQKKDRDSGYLLRGARLDQYKDWATEATVRLTRAEQEFLTAGVPKSRPTRQTACAGGHLCWLLRSPSLPSSPLPPSSLPNSPIKTRPQPP